MDLKEIVKSKGITQVELAKKLNLKQNTVSDMLNRKIRPTFESVLILSNLLDVDVKQILLFYIGEKKEVRLNEPRRGKRKKVME